MRFVIIAALFLAITNCGAEQQVAQPQTAQLIPPHCHVEAGLPDASCTTGAVFANVTAAQVCKAGYAGSVRNVPQAEKDQVFAEYGVTSHPTGAYEVDHLVSLELGGSNDIKNLWPEAYTGPDNAHEKDKVEAYLHTQVCSGKMKLQDAQTEIAKNWKAVVISGQA